MVMATTAGLPNIAALPDTAERAADLVRVLTWIYRRDDETVRCRLALTADDSAYELTIQRPWSSTHAAVELFDDALSAFERQSSIERGLVRAGWSLDRFASAAEPRQEIASKQNAPPYRETTTYSGK
jgi:hypothetical protein